MDFQNDIFEVSLIGDMQGQPIFNVLHYVRESIGSDPADAQDIADSWQLDFATLWLTLFPSGYNLQAIRAQRTFRGDNNAISRLPPFSNSVNLPGTRIGESNPACQHIWASYLTEVVDPDIWLQGGSALVAGVEAEITDGSIEPALGTDIESFFNALKVPWTPTLGTDDTLQWSVFSPTRQKAAQVPIAIMVDSVIARLNVSATENRRKGTSRGGFQP